MPRLDFALHPVAVATIVTIILLVGQLIALYLAVAVWGGERETEAATAAAGSSNESPKPFVPKDYETIPAQHGDRTKRSRDYASAGHN